MGAAAWKVALRDNFIGWAHANRQKLLQLIVNNVRFLILPWVRVRNLASRSLTILAKRIGQDWDSLYGYKPVLLETFVKKDRFRGTCYKAANWLHVGQTQGRSQVDPYKLKNKPIKEVFLPATAVRIPSIS